MLLGADRFVSSFTRQVGLASERYLVTVQTISHGRDAADNELGDVGCGHPPVDEEIVQQFWSEVFECRTRAGRPAGNAVPAQPILHFGDAGVGALGYLRGNQPLSQIQLFNKPAGQWIARFADALVPVARARRRYGTDRY